MRPRAKPLRRDPNAVVKPVGPVNTVLPAAEAPAAAPDQVNDIKPGLGSSGDRNRRRQEKERPRRT